MISPSHKAWALLLPCAAFVAALLIEDLFYKSLLEYELWLAGISVLFAVLYNAARSDVPAHWFAPFFSPREKDKLQQMILHEDGLVHARLGFFFVSQSILVPLVVGVLSDRGDPEQIIRIAATLAAILSLHFLNSILFLFWRLGQLVADLSSGELVWEHFWNIAHGYRKVTNTLLIAVMVFITLSWISVALHPELLELDAGAMPTEEDQSPQWE